jgi:N-methylhydantoinase A
LTSLALNVHPNLRLSVDVGGTFTDTVLCGEGGQLLATAKTLTTHASPVRGAMAGVEHVLATSGHAIGSITGFVHGTTLATNALIERRGARVATVTTAGFRDILEIAYERRYSQYDINLDKPELLVPRSLSFTVDERVGVHGNVLTSLTDEALDKLAFELDGADVDAVAVCLLHSYANPLHERQVRDALIARRPQIAVSISSEVSPEAREYDRLCTTIANVYVQPLMAHYLDEFAKVLSDAGLKCPILMMTSGGGMTTLETARQFPVRLVESGPAGGAILAARIARQLGADRVLSFDMGGTTAKLCLIDDGQPQTSRQFEISRAARFIKGSGMPVRIPVIEMIEIGAGGGSIAAVDRLGRLTVGPRSAGSEPGPAAFGRGGQHPTVTDADVVMGLIDGSGFAEGRLQIDVEGACRAVDAEVGAMLGLSVTAGASGVSDIVDEAMASAARMHGAESGKELGDRLMVAFGGNGPLHATRVARRAGVRTIVVPLDPSVGSAVGFLDAPVSYEVVRSAYTLLDVIDCDRINGLFEEMISDASAVVATGAVGGALITTRTAFARYQGQGHEIEVSLPNGSLNGNDIDALRSAFEVQYASQFGRTVPTMSIEVLNWGVRVATASPDAASTLSDVTRRRISPFSQRAITCDVTGELVDAGVYARVELLPGDELEGPAVVCEPQTTTLISADFTCFVDPYENLVLERRPREGASV